MSNEHILTTFFRRPAQFSSLAVDVSGDLVASGATDVYEVFLWSVATGHLLEVKQLFGLNFVRCTYFTRPLTQNIT